MINPRQALRRSERWYNVCDLLWWTKWHWLHQFDLDPDVQEMRKAMADRMVKRVQWHEDMGHLKPGEHLVGRGVHWPL